MFRSVTRVLLSTNDGRCSATQWNGPHRSRYATRWVVRCLARGGMSTTIRPSKARSFQGRLAWTPRRLPSRAFTTRNTRRGHPSIGSNNNRRCNRASEWTHTHARPHYTGTTRSQRQSGEEVTHARNRPVDGRARRLCCASNLRLKQPNPIATVHLSPDMDNITVSGFPREIELTTERHRKH